MEKYIHPHETHLEVSALTLEQKARLFDRLSSEIDNILGRYLPPLPEKVQPSKTDIAMITISPPPGTDFRELRQLTERITKWKAIPTWAYSYELQESGNPHSHIVIRSQSLKSVKSEINRWNKTKKWNIDFQYRTKEPNDWTKAMTYITKNEPKTVAWRAINDINPVYLN